MWFEQVPLQDAVELHQETIDLAGLQNQGLVRAWKEPYVCE